MLRRRLLFRSPLHIAIAAGAAAAIMIARTCNLPPPSGLSGSRATSQIELLDLAEACSLGRAPAKPGHEASEKVTGLNIVTNLSGAGACQLCSTAATTSRMQHRDNVHGLTSNAMNDHIGHARNYKDPRALRDAGSRRHRHNQQPAHRFINPIDDTFGGLRIVGSDVGVYRLDIFDRAPIPSQPHLVRRANTSLTCSSVA